MAPVYAGLANQYKFQGHMLFSATLYKINEEDQKVMTLNFLLI